MSEFQPFVGGLVELSASVLKPPGGKILLAAPRGTWDWLEKQSISPRLLLITHGHIDHIDDAAKIKRRFNCQVGYHTDSVPLITDPTFYKQFVFFLKPVEPNFLLSEPTSQDFLISLFAVLL